MLKAAFNRGEICWAAPFGHIVWVDENGIPYDISGVNESETDDYIPEYMMGNTINDFKHISGREYDTPKWQIEQMISEWHDIKSEEFGGNVTKIKTKEEAQKYLKSYIVFEVDYHGAYAKKRKYLRKKFKIK